MPLMMGFGGGGWWWVVPVTGMLMMAGVIGVVLPRILRQSSHVTNEKPSPDPLAVARERYAEGRISKSEFDDLVQVLLKTEEDPNK